MAILSAAEISARLFKGTSGFDPLGDEGLAQVDWPAVEDLVKGLTKRNFEEAEYEAFFKIRRNQNSILLADFPVGEVASVSTVTSLAEDGTPALEAYSKSAYRVDAASGIIRLRSGCFPEGDGTVQVVYTAGYSAEDIAANAFPEILVLKSLLLSIIQREYGLNRNPVRHLRSHGYDGESSTFNFDLTFDEMRKIRQLKRWD